jgi:hypothetical protein
MYEVLEVAPESCDPFLISCYNYGGIVVERFTDFRLDASSIRRRQRHTW